MIAHRRVVWNFSLQRAVEWAVELRKPLVLLEALRCGYPWASDRLHRFILEGMEDNGKRLAASGVLYYPYVEASPGDGKGLLAALGAHAAAVVTDDFPAFMLPRMVAAAARQLSVRLEQVDANGLLPLRASDQAFPTAFAFRRFLQKNLHPHLLEWPAADPLAGIELPRLTRLPPGIGRRWPMATGASLGGAAASLAQLPIDHSVMPVATRGSTTEAVAALDAFVRERLPVYHEMRNLPELNGASGLSPHLHFGHISAHQIFARVVQEYDWSTAALGVKATGSRSGWWGLEPGAEAFLDQLITWRELGFNMCAHRPDHDHYESLPAWALETLARHAADPRDYSYTLEEFEGARTHDALWNAAQVQLVREGRIHNYLRMLWGKKILEWSPSPREALAVMIELNNKYALDGRDPNSYSGIFWILGRYDRPWGPERPVFGKIRYMSSQNTARKVEVGNYMRWYAP
jgi:deoxyribodipyrimidine photo-lyase